ncbi:MAG: CRISPR-associated endonuclease Cas2 [Blastocatellia bacterium]|nr:CRISPR-associated endonuclease Cas2 [Blastocatellia bacterium]
MDHSQAKFICITYDVTDGKRRAKLHKALRRFGQAVQYSVFECWLTQQQIAEMQETVARIVADDDSVRYYDLCSECYRHTIAIGTGEKTLLESIYIY